jgi:CRP-like cAMP-binding protein
MAPWHCSSKSPKLSYFCCRLNAMTNENTGPTQLQFDVPASDIAALVHSHPLFAEIDLVALTKLLSRGQILTLHPGDVLLGQGEASDAAYIVIEGSASIRIETRFGRVSLSTVSAPALVGEIGVFTGVPRTATIEATTASGCALSHWSLRWPALLLRHPVNIPRQSRGL